LGFLPHIEDTPSTQLLKWATDRGGVVGANKKALIPHQGKGFFKKTFSFFVMIGTFPNILG